MRGHALKAAWVVLAAIAGLLLLPTASHAAEAVGLVTYVEGSVAWRSATDRRSAKAFARVILGDGFVLEPGARIRITYFDSGRQETHVGPGSFTVGTTRSDIKASTRVETTALPPTVTQRLASVPELLALTKSSRPGGTAVRGRAQPPPSPDDPNVVGARETYQRLRQISQADDITAELFLYAVLHDHGLFEELKPLVAEMQRRQPDNPEVASFASYIATK